MAEKIEKKQVFNIQLSLGAAKKMLVYLEEEFLESYEQFIEVIDENNSDDEIEYYEDLGEILEDFTYELKKEIRRKEREGSHNKNSEVIECESIRKKLDAKSAAILDQIESLEYDDKNLICRFFWYLHSSYDKTGELIFSENSLEELLELNKNRLERFLKNLMQVEIKIGNKKQKLLEEYKFLTQSTIKVKYNLCVVKPNFIKNNKNK